MKRNDFKLWTRVIFLFAAASCTQAQQENKETSPQEVKSSETKQEPNVGDRVSKELVCMVNDAYMGKPQIPILVNGKTYYGCCDMCVKKLNEQEDARIGTDPQSGKKVDKVDAFIVLLDKQGTVGYFESQKTYEAFKSN
jgi:YHS domain-containing protein